MRRTSIALLLAGPLCGCTRDGGPGSTAPGPFHFVDVAGELGIGFRHDNGFDGRRFRVAETVNGGMAMLDFNGDGRLDLFFTTANRIDPGPQPSRQALYRQRDDGKFEDVSKALGVDDDGFAFGCAVADVAGDDLPEILVTRWGANRLYQSSAGARFTDTAREAGIAGNSMHTGSAFLDMDRDGDLDLYVASYVEDRGPEFPPLVVRTVPGYWPPRNYSPAPHHLHENRGDGKFVDVSESSGIRNVLDPGRGLGVMSADFNNDGNPDLYVANDMSANFMFLGDGRGQFREAGFGNGSAFGDQGQELGSMGVAVGDYDGDATLDICVTNYQNQLNNLYHAVAGGAYEDVSRVIGISASLSAEVAWGVGFVDLDHDSWLDLFIGNGHLNPYTQQMDQSTSYAQPKSLFRNRQGAGFEEVSAACGEAVLRPSIVRGAAFGDIDNDGDVDAVLVGSGGAVEALRNQTSRQGAWAIIRLEGAEPNSDAIGARVTLTAGARVQIADRMSGSSYLSVNDPRLHFGLGDAAEITRIEVRWPRGKTSVYTALPARKLLTLKESEAEPVIEDLGGATRR